MSIAEKRVKLDLRRATGLRNLSSSAGQQYNRTMPHSSGSVGETACQWYITVALSFTPADIDCVGVEATKLAGFAGVQSCSQE